MTQNQIAYLKYAEDVRANKAKERAADIQAQAARKQADVAEAKLYETSILGSKLPIPGIVYGAGDADLENTKRAKTNRSGSSIKSRSLGDLLFDSLKFSSKPM